MIQLFLFLFYLFILDHNFVFLILTPSRHGSFKGERTEPAFATGFALRARVNERITPPSQMIQLFFVWHTNIFCTVCRFSVTTLSKIIRSIYGRGTWSRAIPESHTHRGGQFFDWMLARGPMAARFCERPYPGCGVQSVGAQSRAAARGRGVVCSTWTSQKKPVI